MENLEKIKIRIKNLLEKTTENGASESEMLAAINKATELMEKYSIVQEDLKNIDEKEKCVFKEFISTDNKIYHEIFIPELSKLFDCKVVFVQMNRKQRKNTVIGFETDVDLYLYFYNFIIETSKKELEKYKFSKEYIILNLDHHAKKLNNSFLRGFFNSLSNKIRNIYNERQASRCGETGLIFVGKEKKVINFYEDLFPKVKERTVNLNNNHVRKAVLKGMEEGEKVNLTFGLNSEKQKQLLK